MGGEFDKISVQERYRLKKESERDKIMSFGKKMKQLRKERDMTQERLAELLSISPQAVSRWETDVAMPDISLIPVICNLFDVSSDELLGIGIESKNKRIQEIVARAYGFSGKGYAQQAREILESGLREFPNNDRLVHDLMYVCYTLGKDEDYADREEAQKRALELGERILAHCTVDSYRGSAALFLCFLYRDRGEIARAKALAESLPSLAASREVLLGSVTQGDERLKRKRIVIGRYWELMSADIQKLNTCLDSGEWAYTDEEMAILRNKLIAVTEILYEDGDFGFYHTRLCHWHRAQAKYYALNRQESETLHHLNKAAEHAIAFVTAEKGSVHTSLLFRGDPLRGFLTDDKRNDASRVLHEMEKERYDFVREHEEFIKMTEALRTYAGNWKAEI